jgi:hypothetical protein
MDINENGIDGKGGFYGVDVHDGRLLWYFDVETGATCQTLPGDDVRRFDGYHSESDLGLPSGFLASRPGCNFDRQGDGCGGVWSSASVDARRRLLFFTSSACGGSGNTRCLLVTVGRRRGKGSLFVRCNRSLNRSFSCQGERKLFQVFSGQVNSAPGIFLDGAPIQAAIGIPVVRAARSGFFQ